MKFELQQLNAQRMATNIVFPFACVKDYIEKHPLTALTRSKPEDVYDVIVEILTFEKLKRDKSAPPKKEANVPVKSTLFQCPGCKCIVYEVDTKEATRICSKCGVCVRYTDETMRDYDKEYCTIHCSGGGEPSWYNVSMTAEEQNAYDIEKAMQQWIKNPYARVALDQATYELTKERASLPLRANPTNRVVGATMVHFILQKVDVPKIEQLVRSNKPLPTIYYEEPLPQFSCQKCGAAVWTLWESRRHPCGWGKKRKR